MIGIYKITSPNGKIYIGQSVNIKRRWNQHKYQKLDTILSRSFKKYGVDNDTFEILCECEISELNEKERYYQDYYNAIGLNGLNSKLTQTNDKSGYTTEEVKLKIKISRIDKKEEKEYKFEDEIESDFFINDYEQRIFEYNEKREKEEKEFESKIKRQIQQEKDDIEFYWLLFFEEEERMIDSMSI